MALIIQLIKGVSTGLEYFEHDEYGFGVNLDLGIVRVTWYRDIELVDEGDGDE